MKKSLEIIIQKMQLELNRSCSTIFLNCLQFLTVLKYYEYIPNKEISLENDNLLLNFYLEEVSLLPALGKQKHADLGTAAVLLSV